MVIAGEVSGDMHAAQAVRALQAADPELAFWGIGGDRLAACGMEILVHAEQMAVVGLTEVLKRYGFFRRVFQEMLEACRERAPDVVLLVDYPGFNLRFARQVFGTGPKVLYYVCPQVWAWKRSRIPRMAACLDRLMVIFPFEVGLFAGTGLQVDYVGHPLVGEAAAAREAELVDLGWGGEPKLALLPGSRAQEVARILPVLLETVGQLQGGHAKLACIIAAADEDRRRQIEREVVASGVGGIRVVVGQTRQILRQADAALVASGTATLETALMGCPMVVVYKTAGLTWWVGKRVVKVPYIGMVNILAGRALCPECLQGEATVERLATNIEPLLHESETRREMLDGLQEVRNTLETVGGTSVASIVLDELGK